MASEPTLPNHTEFDATGHTGLWTALAVLDRVLARDAEDRDCRPLLPSAGAIYPYEIVLLTSANDMMVFEIDAVRRTCVLLPPNSDVRPDPRPLGLADRRDGDVHIVVLCRPWMSMRKYGNRGYLYASLDAAHLATALLGTAISVGVPAELRHAIARRDIAALIGAPAQHREVHSIVSLPQSAQVPGLPPPPGWQLIRQTGPRMSQRGILADLERLCWTHVPAASHNVHRPSPTVRPTHPIAALTPDPSAPDVVSDWWALSARRSSSRSFSATDVPADAVATAIATGGTPLPTDLDGAGDIDVTTFSLAGAGRSVRDQVVAVCNGQDYLRNATSFAIFHADRRRAICPERPGVLQETLLRTGMAAHLIYLGATSLRLGVTAIGGFSTSGWRDLLGLGRDDDPLYVMAFGTADAGGVKLDRLNHPQIPVYASSPGPDTRTAPWGNNRAQ